VVIVAIALPVLLLGGVLVAQLTGGEPDEPSAPFAREVAGAYVEVNPALLALAETASRWSTGDAREESLLGALDRAEALLPGTRAAVAALDEPRGAEPAKALFLATADLYAVYIDVLRHALRADDDAGELDLLARRTRTLADRLYDRGRAIVSPSDEEVVTPGVTVVRSAPVPDWSDDGLASALDAGSELEREARRQRDDEAGRRRALRLLVLAESERAGALGLGDTASTLGEIAASIDEG
jgi:hypothetical protein